MYNTFTYNQLLLNALLGGLVITPSEDITDPIFLSNEASTITIDNNNSIIDL